MPQKSGRGYLYFIFMLVLAVIGDTMLKVLGERSYPPLFIVWFRMAGGLLIGSFYFLPRISKVVMAKKRPMQFIRAFLLILSGVTASFSLRHLPISYYTALAQLTPTVISLGAVFFLKEKVSMLFVIALIISFIGALLIINLPTGDEIPNSIIRYSPLGVVVFFSAFSLLTRSLSTQITQEEMLVNFYFNSALISSIFLYGNWVTPQWDDVIPLGVLLIANIGVQYCLIHAYTLTPASQLAPLAYLQLILALGVGILRGEKIGIFDLLGCAFIVFGGFLVVTRNKNRDPDMSDREE